MRSDLESRRDVKKEEVRITKFIVNLVLVINIIFVYMDDKTIKFQDINLDSNIPYSSSTNDDV